MTGVIVSDTAAATGFAMLADLQQLAGDVIGLATTDPARAARLVRAQLLRVPETSHGELVASVARRLDDHTLQALSQLAAGRDLLVALASRPHDQIGRLSDALYAPVSAGPTAAAPPSERESWRR